MSTVLRGPLLNPKPDRTIDFHPDGVLVANDAGTITFVGDWSAYARSHGGDQAAFEPAGGLICPPMLDLHTHVPQWPIRGRFTEGVDITSPGGRLLAGLKRNVFPAEERFASLEYARHITDQFQQDALANGVVGGCVFLTVHPEAAFDAMARLGPLWHGGLVLMDQNCPERLRNNRYVQVDLRNLAESLGRRLVVTDRFAVATSSSLRQYGSAIAREFGLMTQTHLNEQITEKRYVEETLYPDAQSYTHVYLRDGLLDTQAIVAHCVHMTESEWSILQSRRAIVAHCPTSNALLGSGICSLDEIIARQIDYAICTDVGASPTTSLLAEMAMFLLVHRGRSRHATACEAVWRTTLGPARMLGVDSQVGRFAVGMPLSYIVRRLTRPITGTSAEDVIRDHLLDVGSYRPVTTEEDLAELSTGAPSMAALLHLQADADAFVARAEGAILRTVLAE